MVKVSDVVRDLIARSPFLTEALDQGLINHSALARQLLPRIQKMLGKEVREGAVVMAIKRLPATGLSTPGQRLRAFFRQLSDISVRSNLLAYTFRNSDTLLAKQARLLERIGEFPNLFYTFSHGVGETTILLSEVLGEEMDVLFAREQLLDMARDLSAVTLLLPEENRQIYGIYYFILRELAWRGINMVELISTSNEFTIIIQEADLERSFQVLMALRDRPDTTFDLR